jgi:hypothetical protein
MCDIRYASERAKFGQREMATYGWGCLKDTKQLTHNLMGSGLDDATSVQEWLFRTYIGQRTTANV